MQGCHVIIWGVRHEDAEAANLSAQCETEGGDMVDSPPAAPHTPESEEARQSQNEPLDEVKMLREQLARVASIS